MSWHSNLRLLHRIILCAACCLLAGAGAVGAEFRLTFLDTQPALDDTCARLNQTGFPEPTVAEFKALVTQHNRAGHRVDLRRFPPPKDGYHTFAGIADLTNRLACHLGRTPADNTIAQNTLVCFDVAGLLLRSAGHGAPLLYENFAAKPILSVSPEREVGPAVLTRFRQEAGLLSPPENYRHLVGRPRGEAETQLVLALTAPRRLPTGLTDSHEGLRAIHAEHIRQVKADGFRFPTKYELGLVFYVDVKRGFIKADHAFICFPQGDRLVTVEKTSSSGPYVRAEFGALDDLALYSSLGERGDTNNPKDCDYGSSVVVSLNERVIGTFRPGHLR